MLVKEKDEMVRRIKELEESEKELNDRVRELERER